LAVKIFTTDSKYRFGSEMTVYNELTNTNFPTLNMLCYCNNPCLIFLSPVGRRLNSCYDDQIIIDGLFNIYRKLVQKHIVHRDIRPENFVITRDQSTGKEKLSIIDWSTAIKEGTKTSFAGTVLYASDRILNNFVTIEDFNYFDDLCSIAKVLVGRFNCTVNSILQNVEKGRSSYEYARNVWEAWKQIYSRYKNVHSFIMKASEGNIDAMLKQLGQFFNKESIYC
jgi:serine/threonine protein kinase